MNHDTALCEITGAIELSSVELEMVCGGGSCPGSNGLPFGDNSYPGANYNYGGNPYQGAGYNYGGTPDNGYGFSQLPPCQVPPPPCPYSSY